MIAHHTERNLAITHMADRDLPGLLAAAAQHVARLLDDGATVRAIAVTARHIDWQISLIHTQPDGAGKCVRLKDLGEAVLMSVPALLEHLRDSPIRAFRGPGPGHPYYMRLADAEALHSQFAPGVRCELHKLAVVVHLDDLDGPIEEHGFEQI